MNSEELENSLRTEFESYLNNVFAEMRQEVSEFQEKFQTEFEKHKSQMDTIFRDFSSRLENDKQLDEAFRESVVEHLRLAKDEGARITAAAIAEAEDLEKANAESEAAAVSADYSRLREAVGEISSQTSQSAILKSLVNHAANFTPRGAFFIVKNEHFVGWRVFGDDGAADEQAVREIYFPIADETVLSESIRSLSAVESAYGTYAGDAFYLNKLGFGQPDRMYAIPLVARGRGVAVLYADNDAQNSRVNTDALETLVRIAGMTVELLAASHGAKPPAAAAPVSAPPVSAEAPAAQIAEPVESAASEAQTYETPGYETNTSYQTKTSDEYSSSADERDSFAAPVEYAQPAEPPQSRAAEEMPNETAQSPDDYAQQSSADYVQQTSTDDYFQPISSPDESYETKNDWQQNYQQPEFESPSSSPQFQTETPTASENSYSWNQPTAFTDNYGENIETAEPETPAFDYSGYNDAAREDFSAAPPSNDFTFTPHQPTEEPASEFQNSPTENNSPQFNASPAFESWQKNDYEAPNYGNSGYETGERSAESSFESNYRAPATESFSPPAPIETGSDTGSAAPVPPVKSRLSERNVDLPIEVGEEDRRLHNDARRFARLLVSEIKLYNEQKVREGRDENDLYDRLREAIDRSREMYEKRVQAPVAAKFDYFHYELVNNLAEGEERKLGGNYPGSVV